MAEQVGHGKAFEFALLDTIYNFVKSFILVEVERDSSFGVAQNCFDRLPNVEQIKYIKAAKAAIAHLCELEPRILNPSGDEDILTIKIQPDSAGILGDVRDILTMRYSTQWVVGISAKKDHAAVKHSRLSASINFGEKWLGVASGDNYFNSINPIFEELKRLQKSGMDWRELPNKDKRFYIPILDAFRDEIIRIDGIKDGLIAPKLLQYLIGVKDFYKVIKRNKKTEIQGYNLNGTLNRSYKTKKTSIKVPSLKFPTRIIDIAYKPKSTNTLIVTFDEGWQISFRIHNASSKVEPSLKFDVQLVGSPSSLYRHIIAWS